MCRWSICNLIFLGEKYRGREILSSCSSHRGREREIYCAATRSTSMAVPYGYRFHPTDEELLVYLKRKIHNLPLPCDIIKEVELYKYDPSELTGLF